MLIRILFSLVLRLHWAFVGPLSGAETDVLEIESVWNMRTPVEYAEALPAPDPAQRPDLVVRIVVAQAAQATGPAAAQTA